MHFILVDWNTSDVRLVRNVDEHSLFCHSVLYFVVPVHTALSDKHAVYTTIDLNKGAVTFRLVES
jgi:hypothetical protein